MNLNYYYNITEKERWRFLSKYATLDIIINKKVLLQF